MTSAFQNGDGTLGSSEGSWDAVETYFNCISECSLDDGECVTRCVEELKAPGPEGGEPA
ncbi:MAG: hypothetical protein ACOYMY_03115 [Prochlorococcaceae cyanobacterium]|jgi:hypothetical protein